MKTLQEIDKAIAAETKGKTAVDALQYKIATYAAYYDLARLQCEKKDHYIILLEKEIETLKNK